MKFSTFSTEYDYDKRFDLYIFYPINKVFIFSPNKNDEGKTFKYRLKTIGLDAYLTKLVSVYLRKSENLYKISLGMFGHDSYKKV